MEGRQGLAIGDGFFNGNQARGVEAPGVGGEIAVCQAGLGPELNEGLARFGCKGGEDAKPAGIGDEWVDAHVTQIIGLHIQRALGGVGLPDLTYVRYDPGAVCKNPAAVRICCG